MDNVLPTTVVGSYPQPDWLIDREQLRGRLPPRIRAHELGRVPDEHLQEAQDAATLLAISDMERTGVDIVGDGEIRRESYSNWFANALEGIDSRELAFAKLHAMVEGTKIVRAELSRTSPSPGT